MKAIVTGMNGTVAPALGQVLAEAGHEVVAWDRTVVPAEDAAAGRAFIRAERPDCFFHVATGSPDWAENVARTCAEEGIAFLFTGSVSVFADSQQGPFRVEDVPAPDDDYGRYKLEVERRVQAAHPAAQVVRLGWQIGTEPGGNHMVTFLERTFQAEGRIRASRHWYPACSFLSDSAEALLYAVEALPAGLYLLDGNPGLSFYGIVSGLNRLRGEPWEVEPTDEPARNNRMVDERLPVAPLTAWFDPGEG